MKDYLSFFGGKETMESVSFQPFRSLTLDIIREMVFLVISEGLSLGSILKAIAPFEPIYNEIRREKMNASKEEGKKIEIFRSKRVWQAILRRLGEVIHRFHVSPPPEKLFRLVEVSRDCGNSAYSGFFELKNLPGKVGVGSAWNKYLLDLNDYVFIDENGDAYENHFYIWECSNNYFIGLKGDRLAIYTDTPWNDDFLVFETVISYPVYQVGVLRSPYGLYLHLNVDAGMNMSREYDFRTMLYHIDFQRKSLTEVITDLTAYKSKGSTFILDNGKPWDFFKREEKKLKIPPGKHITAVGCSGLVGIDLLEASGGEWIVYDSIKDEVIRSFKIDASKYFPLVFDSLIVIGGKVFDLITGDVLFNTDLPTADDSKTSASLITRKKDGTGYYLWR